MEHNIELASGAKIKIPENCIAKIEGDMVIIEENKPKFKKGDFILVSSDFICIVDEIYSDGSIVFQCFFDTTFERLIIKKILGVGYKHNIRLATPEEKQLLLDKLHENGKDWDKEKLEIVDYAWKPQKGDTIWYIGGFGGIEHSTIGQENYKPVATDFLTKELAEAALEVLKNLKHY